MTKEYSRIIRIMEDIGGLNEEQAAAVAEACDIVHDYEAACATAARMTALYETPGAAVRKGNLGYCCPNCGKWIRVPDSWCHWCGKRIAWDYIENQRRTSENEQADKGSKTKGNGRRDPGVLRPRRDHRHNKADT